jgi:hypothetical protein
MAWTRGHRLQRPPHAYFYRDPGEAAATSARNLVLQSRDRRIARALAIARKIQLHCQGLSDIAPRLFAIDATVRADD